MNILHELAKEHSRDQAMKIASYACASQKNFRELVHCFMSADYQIAQRAAWSLGWAARQNPGMIMPYISDLVTQMQRSDVHDAVVRNALRILEVIEIPEPFHGEVMNACFRFIESHGTPVAVKAFALTTVFNLSKIYPEIRAELKLIIQERWDQETAAFRSRGRKILKAIG